MILRFVLLGCLFRAVPLFGQEVLFEEAVVNIGNLGVTVTNAGFIGRANVRNNPTGPPSFEYPLDTGIEHLFEAGLWIGAVRSDGVVEVRSGAVTSSGGYRPGATGYEFAQTSPFTERSRLPESDFFSPLALSHQDLIASFVDTAQVLPGTSIPMPDPEGRLGAAVTMTARAWNFPFTESFVLLQFDLTNHSTAAWDSVYVGLFHDLVVRNLFTTTDTGTPFFNKGGYGYLPEQGTSYAFNAGGTEETVNTYGAIAFLGAEWQDPRTGQPRFFHPNVAADYVRDGYAPPRVNPRWWPFSGASDELSRPVTDEEQYRRMATPYPNPLLFPNPDDLAAETQRWYERLRTDGTRSAGNWIGLTSIGPFPQVAPGTTLRVTFALVAALKPEVFQGQAGKHVDTPESRALLVENLGWAQRTYGGEDNNLNGMLDAGEDVNGNGVLDRFLIPEPPAAPRLRVQFEDSTDPRTGQQRPTVVLYWDDQAEASRDPVTGLSDFEGYRLYRTNPGDDRQGNLLDEAVLIAQFDRTGNAAGFNNGFDEIALATPVTFPGDETVYRYRFEAADLLSGWQYLVSLTAFDTGDTRVGLPSFESSRTANATRFFPGTPAVEGVASRKVGVYPNPYRLNAAWDGDTSRTRRLNFYNLPRRAEIRIYTLAGEVVAALQHDADDNPGDIRWYDTFSAENRVLPGGEHSWDLLSGNGLPLASGLYLFTVKDLTSGTVQTGKFVILQ
jgi:hypothetical protein